MLGTHIGLPDVSLSQLEPVQHAGNPGPHDSLHEEHVETGGVPESVVVVDVSNPSEVSNGGVVVSGGGVVPVSGGGVLGQSTVQSDAKNEQVGPQAAHWVLKAVGTHFFTPLLNSLRKLPVPHSASPRVDVNASLGTATRTEDGTGRAIARDRQRPLSSDAEGDDALENWRRVDLVVGLLPRGRHAAGMRQREGDPADGAHGGDGDERGL